MKSVKGYTDECCVLEPADAELLDELRELMPVLRKLKEVEDHKEEVHKAAKKGFHGKAE